MESTFYGTEGLRAQTVSSRPVYPGLRSRGGPHRLLFLAALVLGIIGLAATAAVLGGNKVLGSSLEMAMVNVATKASGVEFEAENMDQRIHCDQTDPDIMDYLPKFDSDYSTADTFHNACYYAFRCCTTTSNGNGCYVSEGFGDACRSCLKRYQPKVVRDACTQFLEQRELNDDPTWNLQSLMEDDGVPTTNILELQLQIENWPEKSCWKQPSMVSDDAKHFSDMCFEVVSWCKDVCPRDAANSVEHVACKHCTMYGAVSKQDGMKDVDEFYSRLLTTNGVEGNILSNL